MDAQTGRYLTDLAEHSGASAAGSGDPTAPMTVRTVTAVPHADAVEAFIGSRLGAWNAACLASPYGMLFSSVSGWQTTRVRTEEGQSLEVFPVGSVNRSELAEGLNAAAWLQAQVRSRGLDSHRFTDLERIVFEDGRIVGVELATSDGLLAVGIRHGLALSGGESSADLPPVVAGDADELQMCLVGKSASRFLRLELLGTTARSRPMCTQSGRRLREALHGTRSPASDAWRCGKLR